MPTACLESPIGPILLESDGRYLTALRIGEGGKADTAADPVLASAIDQLERYFAGETVTFDLPLAPAKSPRGGALRDAIVSIGLGETVSYGGLAQVAASSARAIGQACARNPFPIIVPCHRVTGAGGALGHYSAGDGTATKRWLLEHERRDR